MEPVEGVLNAKNSKKFLQRRKNHQRIENYLQLAKAVQFLHENQIIHRSIQPSKIAFVGEDFKIFKLSSFESIVANEYYSPDTFSLTNPPETIEKNQFRVSYDQDVYSLGMTMAILEIGVANYIKYIEENKTIKNYQRRYFNKLKKKIIKQLSITTGVHRRRPNILIQFFRWMKMVALKQRVYIQHCIDLLCVIDSCLQYDKENRPTIHQVVQKLNEIYLKYNKSDYEDDSN